MASPKQDPEMAKKFRRRRIFVLVILALVRVVLVILVLLVVLELLVVLVLNVILINRLMLHYMDVIYVLI